ncbi:MAG: hypothetical protein NTY50_18065, partial [Methylobacter sp.]|nr:hypothetical protein [Methylobacter sp.]
KALFDPLILTFSRREKGLSILNLMAVTPERGNYSGAVGIYCELPKLNRHAVNKTIMPDYHEQPFVL